MREGSHCLLPNLQLGLAPLTMMKGHGNDTSLPMDILGNSEPIEPCIYFTLQKIQRTEEQAKYYHENSTRQNQIVKHSAGVTCLISSTDQCHEELG